MAVKEIPMLFSTLMVEADLAGTKTETRRTRGLKVINENPDDWELHDRIKAEIGEQIFTFRDKVTKKTIDIKSPYGKKGDLIYVRETWVNCGHNGVQDGKEEFDVPIYKASENGKIWEQEMEGWRWKPAIHMPKTAARIWHEVIAVHIERLHDITDAGAIAEGIKVHVPVPGDGGPVYKNYMKEGMIWSSPINSYQSLWESINGTDSWAQNPWVWVMKYKVVSTTGRPE